MLEFLAQSHILALILIALSIPISKILFIVVKKFVLHITSKTTTTLDDVLVGFIEAPVEFAMVLIGGYLAFFYTGLLADYASIINPIFGTLTVLDVMWLLFSLINGFIKWHSDNRQSSKMQKTVYSSVKNIVFIVIFLISFVIILRIFNIEMTPLVASLGIGGLAVALALQSTLSNYFAGLYIAADGSMKIGDYIESTELNGIAGYVEKIGWRTTRLRTVEDNLIVVPNAKLSETVVTNYCDPVEELTIKIPCGVAYGSDLDKVEKLTIETAEEILEKSEGGVKGFKPFIRYNKFGESNIEFNVFLRIQDFDFRGQIVHDFIKELYNVYKKSGIEISYPTRKIFMEKA